MLQGLRRKGSREKALGPGLVRLIFGMQGLEFWFRV